MIRALLICAMLFQASPQTAPKPSIDNDRVTVWEVTGHATVQPLDAVVVSLSGSAAFLPKGTTPNVAGSGRVLAFARRGPQRRVRIHEQGD